MEIRIDFCDQYKKKTILITNRRCVVQGNKIKSKENFVYTHTHNTSDILITVSDSYYR